MWSLRKATSAALAAAVLGMSMPLVGLAAAGALASCPVTAILSPFGVGSGGLCVDRVSGATIGEVSPNGQFLAVGDTHFTIPDSKAKILNKPSSVLGAAEDTGLSTAEKASLAGANGSRVGLSLTRGLSTVGLIITAGTVGYELGNGIDRFACGQGLSALCRPGKSSTFVPNITVVATSGDPGWADGLSFVYGDTTFTVASGTGMALTVAGPDEHVQLTLTKSNPDSSAQPPVFQLQCNGGAYQNWNGFYMPSGIGVGQIDRAFNVADNCGAGGQLTATALRSADGSALLHYYPVGSILRPGAVSPNPERKLVDDVRCKSLSDGHILTISGTSTVFTELDLDLPTLPDVGCPPGYRQISSKVSEVTPSDPHDVPVPVVTQEVPAPVQSWQDTYPQCGDGTCQLKLYKVRGTALDSCFATAGLCANWFADPSKADDYVCKYGSTGGLSDSSVALSECDVYAPSFNPVAQAKGTVYADPVTGDAPEQPVSSPTSNPTTDPTTDPSDPEGGAGAVSGGSCFPSGWSAFNPVEWVFKPIKCALVWAFIPDVGAISTSVDQTVDLFTSKPPGSVVMSVVPVVKGFGVGLLTDCTGQIADFGSGLVIPCSVPGNPAWAQTLYWIASIGVVWATAFGMWQIVQKGMVDAS